MAPISSLSSAEPDSFQGSEKKIWMIVVPLSICIPVLIACSVYVARRYQHKKAQQQRPTSQGASIEAHHRAWLEHMQKISQNDQQTPFAAHETGTPDKIVHLHDFTQHDRSQSTPPVPPPRCRPPRSDSPLRREFRQSEKIPDKDLFEFPLPQEQHPAMRRDSIQ